LQARGRRDLLARLADAVVENLVLVGDGSSHGRIDALGLAEAYRFPAPAQGFTHEHARDSTGASGGGSEARVDTVPSARSTSATAAARAFTCASRPVTNEGPFLGSHPR
jgi:hypothetical protein